MVQANANHFKVTKRNIPHGAGIFPHTTREKVVDIGPIHATREETHNIPIPPIAGGLALGGGIVLLVAGGKK